MPRKESVQNPVETMFGIRARGQGQQLVVLDKSFLQGVTGLELQFYVQKGWVFVIPEVLWYEHFRTWDQRRFANLRKLKSVEKDIVLLPGIGEMFRAEARERKPASQALGMKTAVLNKKLFANSQFFELDEKTRRTSAERTVELEDKLDLMVELWTAYRQFPEFENAKSEDMPGIVRAKSIQIRDDRNDMRGVFTKYGQASFPPADMIDENWIFFRWIQVQLLAGLDFFASYGLGAPFNREDLFHELLDLDYLIPALVVGGLACRERRCCPDSSFFDPTGLSSDSFRWEIRSPSTAPTSRKRSDRTSVTIWSTT